jgi:hypothetical protein
VHLDDRFANRQSKSQPLVLGLDLLEWFEYSVQRLSFQPYTVVDDLDRDLSRPFASAAAISLQFCAAPSKAGRAAALRSNRAVQAGSQSTGAQGTICDSPLMPAVRITTGNNLCLSSERSDSRTEKPSNIRHHQIEQEVENNNCIKNVTP